jgi:hypothetical protein
LHVRLVTVGTVPIVSIAFDRQTRLSALNHEINSLSRDFMLGKHSVISAKKFQGNVNLEPTFEWVRRLYNASIVLRRSSLEFGRLDPGNLLRLCVLEEIKQLSPKTRGAKIVTGDGMEKNHRVTGATGRDIEASLVRSLCERPDSFIAGRDERQKHDVAFIALKTVRIAADQATPFHFLGPQSFEQLILDQSCLRFTLKDHHAYSFSIVPTGVAHFGDPFDDDFGFRAVDNPIV